MGRRWGVSSVRWCIRRAIIGGLRLGRVCWMNFGGQVVWTCNASTSPVHCRIAFIGSSHFKSLLEINSSVQKLS